SSRRRHTRCLSDWSSDVCSSDLEQRGVGAPTYAYRLSARGEALFPRAYEEALTDVLGRVAEKSGREAAVELFEDRYRELARSLLAQLSGATVAERLDHVARLMSEQG